MVLTKIQQYAELREQGYTLKEIAEEMGTNIAHVSRSLKKYDEENENSEFAEFGDLDETEKEVKELQTKVNQQAQELKNLKSELEKKAKEQSQKDFLNEVVEFFDDCGFLEFDTDEEEDYEVEVPKKEILKDYGKVENFVVKLKELMPQDYPKSVIFKLFNDFADSIKEVANTDDFEEAKRNELFDFSFEYDFVISLQEWCESPSFALINTKPSKKTIGNFS